MGFTANRELLCILSLSISFMLLFSSEITLVNMQKTIVSSITDDRPGFRIEGYTVSGITYTLFAISVWCGPYINYALGPRLTMVLSATGYLFNFVAYLLEEEWAVYGACVALGVSAGILWPAQGHYMIQNSSPETTNRNVGIFWFIFSIAGLIGNIFVYFTFHGKKYIHQSSRRLILSILLTINVIAVFSFMTLPKSKSTQEINKSGPIKNSIKKSLKLLISPKMLWLVFTFCYAGLQQSFLQGIYSPSIGFTLGFGDSAKGLVAVSGMFMSLGSFLGSFGPIVFSGWIRRHSYARRLIVMVGVLAQLVAYLITYINLPNSAVFGNTNDESIIQPSAALAMLGSTLLSFGDFSITTQIYSLIGDNYRETCAEACAIYKFVKSVFVATSFYFCSHLGLHTQVAIMAAFAVFGIVAFCVADRDCNQQSSDTVEQNKAQTQSNEKPSL